MSKALLTFYRTTVALSLALTAGTVQAQPATSRDVPASVEVQQPPTPLPQPVPSRPPSTRPPSTRPPSSRPPSTRPPSTRPPSTRPPPARPPARARADLSVSVQPRYAENRVDRRVSFTVLVRNRGPSRASRVHVDIRSHNLAGLSISGACSRRSCNIGSISSGRSARIVVSGRIVSLARFGVTAEASAAQFDPRRNNNRATSSRLASRR